MKKEKILTILLISILLLPYVFAQETENDFNNYNKLTLRNRVDASFNLKPSGSSPTVKEVDVSLTFFPQNDDLQKVQTSFPFSSPSARMSKDTKEISYIWTNPSLGSFNYGVESTVEISNALVIIDKKIPFPIQTINNEYTKATEYIDITPEIKEQANQIVLGEDDSYAAAFKMATWINKNIDYNLTTLTADVVEKSSWVLENRQGVCDEITNLFISMSRSVGIPARFVYGVAYTNVDSNWGPHGWAEIYLPDKGWVPFDVTYGQFGWIDPSHLKLKERPDSGDPTVRYSWKSSNTQLEGGKINIQTTLLNKEEKISSPLRFNIKPLTEKVAPGSYVPVKIEIVNDNNYYVPDYFIIKKAPELTEENIKHVLLRPNEIKNIYWIVKIPEDTEESYIYTTTIEVEDQFHETSSNKITYASNYDLVSLDEAKRRVQENGDKEELNTISKNLELKCPIDKEIYSYENKELVCTVKNLGNIPLKELQVCFTNECITTDLGIAEEKSFNFKLDVNPGEYIFKAKAFNNEVNVIKDVQVKIIDKPELEIKRATYNEEVNYDEKFVISLLITSDADLKDATIYVEGGEFKIGELNNLLDLSLNLNTKDIYSVHKDSFEIKVVYKDKNNKQYETKKDYKIKVNNVPFYIKILSYLKLV